jgi:Polyketide cyclase / dehydrase and lipid transport
MAIRATREILIEAPRSVVMDALADVSAWPSYSSMHKHVDVVDRYPDGRPHHVRVKVRVLGLSDTEVLEYRWGPDWLVWDAEPTSQQYAQHVEYRLVDEDGGESTRMRVDVTVEPAAPVPEFLVKRASAAVLDAQTAGVRQLALRNNSSHHVE